MSTRRSQSHVEKPHRSKCTAAICFSWKIFTCVVSHVTLVSLVVAYCIGGALLFQHLEQDYEMEVKKGIKRLRENITDSVWEITEKEDVLMEQIWTKKVELELENFEKQILTAIKTQGWDGEEGDTQTQWTFFGALFYSIIVITTIGYGHIAPRTDWGKVTTIFYAILGIPLMLLCLSNIGDVMATSFRFLYWRVCCFICTREPKRSRRSRSSRASIRHRFSSRSQPPPTIRRSIRTSQRSADSGFATAGEPGLMHAYSDPELRYLPRDMDFQYQRCPPQQYSTKQRNSYREPDEVNGRVRSYPSPRYDNVSQAQQYRRQPPANPNGRFSGRNRIRDQNLSDRHTVERERNVGKYRRDDRDIYDSMEELEIASNVGPGKYSSSPNSRKIRSSSVQQTSRDLNRVRSQTIPTRGYSQQKSPRVRAKSVDPRSARRYEDEIECKAPVYCNRYALDNLEFQESNVSNGNSPAATVKRSSNARSPSVPTSSSRYGHHLEIPEFRKNAPNRYHKRSKYDAYPEAFDDDEDEDDENGVDGVDELEMMPIPSRKQPHSKYRHEAPPPHPSHHRVPLSSKRNRAIPLTSPRIMSPMGFVVNRQARLTAVPPDDDIYYDYEDWDSYTDLSSRNKPVPIWLCVFLVVSYIVAGAFLFSEWEKWTLLDSAYFCFITLTTIGFGDFVPAQGVKANSKESIALCSLYLLFGISLLAMSFNLVQEEVIANVKDVARRLGILKEEEIDE